MSGIEYDRAKVRDKEIITRQQNFYGKLVLLDDIVTSDFWSVGFLS